MKRSVFVVISLLVMAMFWTTGCTQKSTEITDTVIDSTVVDSIQPDTLQSLLEEQPVPKAADELFDDFIFNFAGNRRLQMERVDFPLAVNDNGKEYTIERSKWKMEYFFMRQGFYTLVLGNIRELNATKDTKIESVVVEKIYLKEQSVHQFVFNRVDGLWKLQQLRKENITQNANGSFYQFYDHFVNDSLFRHQSLAEEVEFSGPDPDDDFSRMEGSIMPEQWAMFAPELPKDLIYNIVYGRKPKSGEQRILVIRGIANGFETELTFKKSKTGYVLTKLTT